MMSTCANMCDMAKRVTVILSDDEYAEVRTKAGEVPLSRWFRNLAIYPKTITVHKPQPMKREPKEANTEVPPGRFYHTASSNRLNCLCPSCVAYRANNDIPLGGFK
jgi:hypothetical protein